jgi:hypothetical protein
MIFRQDETGKKVSWAWEPTTFAALDRAPSYVEMLTCLEMAKQASQLPAESRLGATTGSASTGRR